MPGLLLHVAFAEKICKGLEISKPQEFISGNIIPDLTRDKKSSHYRVCASQKGFLVPEMGQVKKDLFVLNDPIKLGMYCHLYLDYHFIERYLIPEFKWDYDNMKVTNPRNEKRRNVKKYFSDDGIYSSYTEINSLLLKDKHISLKKLMELPDLLPQTGIKMFDDRHSQTWKSELRGYLSERKEYTGDIFDYKRLCNFIDDIAEQLMKDVKENKGLLN